jgi:hypothetical protein
MERDGLVRALKPLRVGCRFVSQEVGAQADSQRFSVLGRSTATNRLLTLTVTYGGRTSGGSRVEIVGLRVREPTDADWDALEATPGVAPACRRDNKSFAPDPPAAQPAIISTPPP